MAVAMESFSIREYAAKMRSIDFGRSWPFDGDGKGGELPPIAVSKFRWWADELAVARADHDRGGKAEEPELVKKLVGEVVPVSGEELMLETETLPVEVEEEERPKKSSARAKQRAPKKRSIVELFAVAPPIETVEAEADGGDQEAQEEGDRGERDDGLDENLGTEVGVSGGASEAVLEEPRKRKERFLDVENTDMMGKKIWTEEKMKKKIKKKKKKKRKVEICAVKEDRIGKPKISCEGNISRMLLNKVHDNQSGKTKRKLIDNRKKKPVSVKILPKKRNFKLVRTSKLISRNQKEISGVLPIRSILKSRTTGILKKGKVIGDGLGGNLIKLCCSAKHVSFSGKDDILGHDKMCSPTELSHLQGLCKIFSKVLAASSAMENLTYGDKCPSTKEGAQAVNVNDKDVATSNVENTGGTSSEKKQASDSDGHAIPQLSSTSSTCNHLETNRTPLDESVDLNHAVQGNADLDCFSPDSSTLSVSHTFSSDPNVVNPIHEVRLNSDAGIHGKGCFLVTSAAVMDLPDPAAKCASRSDAGNSLTLARHTCSQNSVSCLTKRMETNGELYIPPLDPKKDVCSPRAGFQPMYHHSPRVYISDVRSSVGSKGFEESRLTSDFISTAREQNFDEDFIGLPLNSRGELIQLHSNNKSGYSELYKKQNLVLNSVHSIPTNHVEPQSSHVNSKGKLPCSTVDQKDQPNWFMEHYYPASKVVTSGIGFTEFQGFQGFERTIEANHGLKDKYGCTSCDPNQMEASFCGCREHDLSQKCTDAVTFHAESNLEYRYQPAMQPTMRLMGKNVTVGQSSERCQEGRVCTDQEITTRNCPSARVSDKHLLQRWPQEQVSHAESAAPRENPYQLFEAPPNIYSTPAAEYGANHVHLDFEPQRMMVRNGISSISGNHGIDVNLFSHQALPQTFLNTTCNSSVNFSSGFQSVKIGHQKPAAVSYPQNVCQHVYLNSTNCKHSQNFSDTTSTICHSAFPEQNHRIVAQTVAHPSANLPHWLLNATQQKKMQQSACLHSDSVSVRQPFTMPGNNAFPLSPQYPSPVISFPFYGNNISQAYDSSSPAFVVCPSFVTVMTANKSCSAVNSNSRSKNEKKDGAKVLAHPMGIDRTDRPRKRPVAKYDKCMKTLKKSNLKLQEDLNSSADPEREQLLGYPRDDTRAAEVLSSGSNLGNSGFPLFDRQKDGILATSGSHHTNSDGPARSGPVKLSAGAKHILKPSQNMDEDNSRPTHSTVPLAGGTNFGRVPVLQRKATKVYRF